MFQPGLKQKYLNTIISKSAGCFTWMSRCSLLDWFSAAHLLGFCLFRVFFPSTVYIYESHLQQMTGFAPFVLIGYSAVCAGSSRGLFVLWPHWVASVVRSCFCLFPLYSVRCLIGHTCRFALLRAVLVRVCVPGRPRACAYSLCWLCVLPVHAPPRFEPSSDKTCQHKWNTSMKLNSDSAQVTFQLRCVYLCVCFVDQWQTKAPSWLWE